MKIILTTLEGNIYPVEVSEDLELINLKALCEQEVNIPASEISLSHNGRPLNEDNKTLANYSIKENDILVVQKIIANQLPMIDFSSIAVPPTTSRASGSARSSGVNPQMQSSLQNMRRMLLADPAQFQMVQQRFPDLADAIQKNDLAKMTQLMGKLASGEQQLLNQNPMSSDYFDLEHQKRIAEAIRLQNIQQNMESALEFMPEAFGNVVMLYIDCQVNGHHVKAFVDSGAQMTIMSAACAERCGIMRLVDTRWSGIAKGVGTQKIVGRVHLAQIQIEKSFLTTAFSILEEQPMDMLLGLDLLKRHQCIIDLDRHVLVIKSANVETKFLPESELPHFARLNHHDPFEETDMPQASTSNRNENNNRSKSSSSENAKLPDNISEASVTNLIKLGYKRNDVIEALKQTNGDENGAKIVLIAKSLRGPN